MLNVLLTHQDIKMTTEEKKTPWKNGYWYNKSQACFLMIIDGEKVELKNLVCLEYPGITLRYRIVVADGISMAVIT